MGQQGQPQTTTARNELSLWEKERIRFTGYKSSRLLAKKARSSKPVHSHEDMISAVGDLFDGKNVSPALPLPTLIDCLSEIWAAEAQEMLQHPLNDGQGDQIRSGVIDRYIDEIPRKGLRGFGFI